MANNLSRRAVWATSAAAMLLFLVGTVAPSLKAEEGSGEKKHLVWDPIDEVNRCLGSPLNCDF